MNYNNKNEVLPLFSKSPSPFPYASDTPRRITRIADILVDDSDSDSDVTDFFDMDGSDQITTIQCSTPRRVVSRWFSALKQRGKGAKFVSRGSEKRDREIGRSQVRRSTNGLNGHDGSRSGRCGKEVKGDYSSFNLGVACGLLYVVAAGRNELTKMVEMRTQMEHILHDARQELHTNNANANANANADAILNSKPLESNDNNLSSFTTDFQQGSSSAGSQFSLQSVANGGGECGAGMDRLEAELEAELERLQLHLDSESDSSISFSAQQQMLRGDGGEAESAIWGCSGVDPFELERKLNQVVEARQEERIRELEDALECAQHKLYHKEMELSWWKNAAATLMSGPGHDPHPTSLPS